MLGRGRTEGSREREMEIIISLMKHSSRTNRRSKCAARRSIINRYQHYQWPRCLWTDLSSMDAISDSLLAVITDNLRADIANRRHIDVPKIARRKANELYWEIKVDDNLRVCLHYAVVNVEDHFMQYPAVVRRWERYLAFCRHLDLHEERLSSNGRMECYTTGNRLCVHLSQMEAFVCSNRTFMLTVTFSKNENRHRSGHGHWLIELQGASKVAYQIQWAVMSAIKTNQ